MIEMKKTNEPHSPQQDYEPLAPTTSSSAPRERVLNSRKGNKAVYIITAVCLLLAGAILCFILSEVSGFAFGEITKQSSTFDFVSKSNTQAGFKREKEIYTNDGITSIQFSGKITTTGTAEISVVSDGGNVAYSKTYTDTKSKAIKFEVTGLAPYSNYTIRFSSNDAQTGSLTLTTEQSLVKTPEYPKNPTPPLK